MALVAAPNNSVEKPDKRRPLLDRSRWPTTKLDSLASRCLHWVSLAFIPACLHIDISRTDAALPSICHFNSVPSTSRVHCVSGDIESCFTNIDHVLVSQSWDYYHACLSRRVPGIPAPRSRCGRVVPFLRPRSLRGRVVGCTLADLGAVLAHHLLTAWLLVGDLVGKQTEGVPMGNALGTALAGMVLIFLDVFFYSFQYFPSIAAANHVFYLNICGVDIVVLGLRYIDDVIGFWKACSCIHDSLVTTITNWLWERLLHRYPLPLERDTSCVFVGFVFELRCLTKSVCSNQCKGRHATTLLATVR